MSHKDNFYRDKSKHLVDFLYLIKNNTTDKEIKKVIECQLEYLRAIESLRTRNIFIK